MYKHDWSKFNVKIGLIFMAGVFVVSALLLLTGCASLPENTGRVDSYAFNNTQSTMLGRYYSEKINAQNEPDGFVFLDKGLDAFVARAILAKEAERSLDMQYFLYHSDLVGKLFSAILWQAAERGVRVRLLLDDMDFGGRDADIIALDAHPNIDVRIFNPFDRDVYRGVQLVTDFGGVTRRMHNKSFTADNVATIVGGRNIGNEYFSADPELEYVDLDVLAVGSVVKEISRSFDKYWNHEMAYPVKTITDVRLSEEEIHTKQVELFAFVDEHKDSDYIKALHDSDLARQLRDKTVQYYWGNTIVVVDDPDKIRSSRDSNELHLMTQLQPYFENLEEELIILSPYFVPGEEGIEFFQKLIDKGVRIIILTSSLSSKDTGVLMAHAGYTNYRKELLRMGIELYELNKKLALAPRKRKKGSGGSTEATLHAKTFVLDRKKVFIGSLNLDPRSFYENTENGLVLEQQEIADDMVEAFYRDIAEDAFRLELKTEISEDGYGEEQLLWHGYENGQPVIFDVDPYTSFWKRFAVGFMSILPIESQL